jgi:Trk-type K+ transport system membrane component
MSIGLLLAGAVVISALEWQNEATLGSQSDWMKPISAVFLSMMARSTGLNSIPTEELSSASLLLLDFLMFVGGGSASTAGGIKVTTLAVLLLAVYAQARGNQDITVFERRIPSEIVRLAVTVTLWGATIVATTTILLMAITSAPLEKVLFESISAFASCGLSAGFTNAELPAAAKFILAATIVIGRLGTITFASALVGRRRTKLFRRASERPILG